MVKHGIKLNKAHPIPIRSDAEITESVLTILPKGICTDIKELDRSLDDLSRRFGPEVYSIFLKFCFNVDQDPPSAKNHVGKMVLHHQEFTKNSKGEIDFRVSSLDYLLRVSKLMKEPTIVEREKFSKIHRDTITDSMTGLYNFRFFRHTLEKEVTRAQRYAAPFSLLFFDVDHFKHINDRLGHLMGDEILRKIADVIASSVRSTDVPCRYGGEEFAVIAPETTREGALLLAERIRNGVALLRLPELKNFSVGLSVSGGISCFPVDASTGEELLKKADHALYRAKQHGRNRIELHRGDKRREPRIPLELTGILKDQPEHQERFSTKNVSIGGLLLEVSAPIPLGSIIQLEVILGSEDDPIRCVGKVTHVHSIQRENSFKIGISIERMPQMDAVRYHQFIQTQDAA